MNNIMPCKRIHICMRKTKLNLSCTDKQPENLGTYRAYTVCACVRARVGMGRGHVAHAQGYIIDIRDYVVSNIYGYIYIFYGPHRNKVIIIIILILLLYYYAENLKGIITVNLKSKMKSISDADFDFMASIYMQSFSTF